MSETTLQQACVAEAIQRALSPIFPDAVFPHMYTGPLIRYVVWNYNVVGEVWAEGVPQAARYLVQVHLYYPHKEDPREAILAMERALFDEGFTATVDGEETEIEKVDGGLMAVFVPAGTHRIVFTYYPEGLTACLRVSAAAAVLLAAGWIINNLALKKKE